MFDVDNDEIRAVVEHALREDTGSGDVTSAATVPESRMAQGKFFARQAIVLAGVELLPVIYAYAGGIEVIEVHHRSGDALQPGDCLATVYGRARTLLSCERVALNFMQRLSGIATLARRYAAEVQDTKCRVLDTRKTTPGLRKLEKMSAAAGGVTNHRQGLFDAVLIKNNHISAAGSVTAALQSAFASFQGPIEIEVRTRAELDEALQAGAKQLLLDNLTPEEAREWIQYIAGRATVELSGNINLQTVRAYALTGADFVSCGAITHSATAVDLNFRLTLA